MEGLTVRVLTRLELENLFYSSYGALQVNLTKSRNSYKLNIREKELTFSRIVWLVLLIKYYSYLDSIRDFTDLYLNL